MGRYGHRASVLSPFPYAGSCPYTNLPSPLAEARGTGVLHGLQAPPRSVALRALLRAPLFAASLWGRSPREFSKKTITLSFLSVCPATPAEAERPFCHFARRGALLFLNIANSISNIFRAVGI